MARHKTIIYIYISMCTEEARTRLLLAPMTFRSPHSALPLTISLTRSLTPPPSLVLPRVSHAFLYLRRFFLKLLYSFSLSGPPSEYDSIYTRPPPPPSENNDACVYPKVNYLPLRRFSYPFGVGTTVRDFAIYNIICTRTHD